MKTGKQGSYRLLISGWTGWRKRDSATVTAVCDHKLRDDHLRHTRLRLQKHHPPLWLGLHKETRRGCIELQQTPRKKTRRTHKSNQKRTSKLGRGGKTSQPKKGCYHQNQPQNGFFSIQSYTKTYTTTGELTHNSPTCTR